MPRNAPRTVPADELPEFLRSKAIGAVIAETLDNYNVVGESASGAVSSMVSDASREIREFHGMHADARPMATTAPFDREHGYEGASA